MAGLSNSLTGSTSRSMELQDGSAKQVSWADCFQNGIGSDVKAKSWAQVFRDHANVHDGLGLAYFPPLKEPIMNVQIDMVGVEEEIMNLERRSSGICFGINSSLLNYPKIC